MRPATSYRNRRFHTRSIPPTRILLAGARRLAVLFLVVAVGAGLPEVAAQEADTTAAPVTAAPALADTTRSAPTPTSPATSASPDSGLKEPVTFSAQDSLIVRLRDDGEGDTGTLVGNARVAYGEATLEAHTIDLLFEKNELHAEGIETDTGRVGLPRFEQGGEAFTGLELAYNLGTERGRIVGGQTAIDGDGFLRSGIAKLMEDSTLFVREGAYTTCDCPPDETPSYSLRASRMKVANRKWIYTGPIQLYIYNIPMPLWLPFGFLPAQEGRRSGPLPPTWGEERELGFYLRDWGYYWAISDYMDLQVQAGLWSRGSWEINPLFRYERRYAYGGQLELEYQNQRRGERSDPDFAINRVARFRWLHRQTLNPTTSFTANVDLTSNEFLRTASEDYEDRVRNSVSSSVQYSKRWPTGGRSLSLSLRQSQTLSTGTADLTIPQLSFTQSSFTPFEGPQRAGRDEAWYERITLSYRGSVDNRYRFTPLPDDSLEALGATDIAWYDALFSTEQYRLATGDDEPFDFQASHSIPVSASFTVNRIPVINRRLLLNVTPNFSYDEDWFLRTERRTFDPETRRTETETVPGFFALRQFDTGVSANTTIYGIFPLKAGPYEGLRHTLRPTVSFTYRPDFYGDVWGYTRRYAVTDTLGQVVEEVEYPIVSGVSPGLQQSVSLTLSNTFETKRVEVDSTGERIENPFSFLDASLSTSYNFAADSFKLADVRLSGRLRLSDQLSVNYSSTFSPYRLTTEETEFGTRTREVDDFIFSLRRFRFARLDQLSLSTSFSFRSDEYGSSSRYTDPYADFGDDLTDPYGRDGRLGRDWDDPYDRNDPFTAPFYDDGREYADFAIPWSFNFDVNYSLTRSLGLSDRFDRRATVDVRFDFNVTPNWKVGGRTGYDFIEQELATTDLSIFRDLDCWEMSFRWVPFGRYQSYGFTLQVKSGKLRDFLRVQQPRSDVRGRFRGLVQ